MVHPVSSQLGLKVAELHAVALLDMENVEYWEMCLPGLDLDEMMESVITGVLVDIDWERMKLLVAIGVIG